MHSFDSAITFLETQLEGIDEKRAKVAAALDGLRYVASLSELPANGRKLNGSTALVLSVMRDGVDKLATIAAKAKIKESTARTAVLALEQAGKIKREGKGSQTRYRPS